MSSVLVLFREIIKKIICYFADLNLNMLNSETKNDCKVIRRCLSDGPNRSYCASTICLDSSKIDKLTETDILG